jgi:hypothetical protein
VTAGRFRAVFRIGIALSIVALFAGLLVGSAGSANAVTIIDLGTLPDGIGRVG